MAASTIHFYFFISFFAAFHSFGGREAGKGGEGGKGGTERGRKAPSSATLRRHPQAPPSGATPRCCDCIVALVPPSRRLLSPFCYCSFDCRLAGRQCCHLSTAGRHPAESDAVAQPIPAPFRSEPMAAGSEQRPQSPANMAAHAG